MINYRVDDLDALLAALAREGVQVDPHREDSEYGRFCLIMDPTETALSYGSPPKE